MGKPSLRKTSVIWPRRRFCRRPMHRIATLTIVGMALAAGLIASQRVAAEPPPLLDLRFEYRAADARRADHSKRWR